MQNKLLSLLFLISPLVSNSQEYVDLLNVSYSKTGDTSFENSAENTIISIFDSKVLLPIVLNEKTALITGFDFNIKKFQLFPNSSDTNLYYTRIKLGIATEHSEKWSGTYVLLPILSSDYKKLSTEDIYLGALAVWTYKKRKNFNYKFGLYVGNEAYGLYVTPLIGAYYISPNSKFEINSIFPGFIDVNLGISNKTKLGIDYKGNSETFKIHNDDSQTTYTENNSLEFSSYIQNTSLTKNLLLRLKIGFATNTYDVYAVNDKINLAITPFRIGDNRTKLNPSINSSAFLKVEAIYRFYTSSK
ncbi:DUF6268 family outer membrane beta-barrel protein [Flavobacterium hiemivividum]|uniref:DUF6268 domain-containing protein n=1 Tax=Flavobacterium hiemivividum TaxID=2541734 RepID=A0A4R5D114_9FLAO|nr:DUF6268 family outer membrane beta-barrel protein [Flavobacterium hiemivividum]TDE03873.1 hypothetical protein E0F98_10240 [Flavobacterium hiemivividum]